MSDITLRHATPDDVDLYYEWANDPEVRRQSFSGEPIPYEAHVHWFSQKMADPSSHLFVMLDGTDPVGQIRFDVVNGIAGIGYSVARHARGRGLARRLVELGVAAMSRLGVTVFEASVKPTNAPSLAVFRRCGFEERGDANCRVFVLDIGSPGQDAAPDGERSRQT